jgi:hypothetical protein
MTRRVDSSLRIVSRPTPSLTRESTYPWMTSTSSESIVELAPRRRRKCRRWMASVSIEFASLDPGVSVAAKVSKMCFSVGGGGAS